MARRTVIVHPPWANRHHRQVAVLGGGVGGLSAAQELGERGFDVTVYEARERFGGKARSVPVPDSATGGREPLPGEHGFRFFPEFYRYLTDSMKRIPYGDNPEGVYDNLEPTTQMLMAEAGRPELFPTETPGVDLGVATAARHPLCE